MVTSPFRKTDTECSAETYHWKITGAFHQYDTASTIFLLMPIAQYAFGSGAMVKPISSELSITADMNTLTYMNSIHPESGKLLRYRSTACTRFIAAAV